jgi:hypothetical protein
MQLISAMADAFRGHGFSLLVSAFLRGLPLMLFPQKSTPPLQSTYTLLEMDRLVRKDKTTVQKEITSDVCIVENSHISFFIRGWKLFILYFHLPY